MRSLGLIILGILTACTPTSELRDGGETYHVYFLGGQSNMEGHGKVWELSGVPAMTHEDVRIFVGNPAGDEDASGGSGRWAALRPGYGHKFYVSGNRNQYSRRFGPELTFGLEMQRLNPNRNVAIIKYARGATSLAPGIGGSGAWQSDPVSPSNQNQLDHAMRAIRTALAVPDIDNDGRRDTLIPAGLV